MSKLAWTSLTSSCSSSASSRPSRARASALADLDRALRLHRHLGGPDLDPGALERLAHRAQVARLAEHPQLVAVLAHVLGAGVDRRDQVVLAVAGAVDGHDAAFLEDPGDRARLAEAAVVLGEGEPDVGAWCGCGCRSAPRRGSRRRRGRSPRRGPARSPPRRRWRRCRGRSPAGCFPWASRRLAPSAPRSPGSGCRRCRRRRRARRR